MPEKNCKTFAIICLENPIKKTYRLAFTQVHSWNYFNTTPFFLARTIFKCLAYAS